MMPFGQRAGVLRAIKICCLILVLASPVAPVLGSIALCPLDSAPPAFKVHKDPALERMFRHKKGWIGGDAADSVPLGKDRVLWLFGDSFLGRIQGGRRMIDAMVRNTVAIQQGLKPENARITFYHGTAGGSSGAIFTPGAGKGWFWPCQGGIRTREGLYIFLLRIVTTPHESSPWGFRTDGMVLAKISNPDAEPDQWIIHQYKVPYYFRDQFGNERSFGIPQQRKGIWVFLSGLDYDMKNGTRYLLAARIRSERLEDFTSWEFRSRGGWTKNFHKATRLCDRVGAELSITELQGIGRHLLVTTENGLSDRIVLRASPTPWGPWGPAVTLYHAPEPRRDRSILCYAAKAHPELARRDDELVVSYVCNTTDPGKLSENPRLYMPEFLRVRFRKPASPAAFRLTGWTTAELAPKPAS